MLSKEMQEWVAKKGYDPAVVQATVNFLLAKTQRSNDPVVAALLLRMSALQDRLDEFKELCREEVAALRNRVKALVDVQK